MSLCQAICKRYPQNYCHNLAKYGNFCGVHRTEKSEPAKRCEGTTKLGNKCTNPVKRGQFCHLHIIPEQPEHDWVELKLYKPDVDWPSMSSILETVKKVKTGRELGHVIAMYKHIYYPISLFPIIETAEDIIQRRDNKFTILMMETFFVNYYLDYSTDHWQDIISDILKKTENLKWLSEYRLLFRKKFDLAFREETKKKYIEKILIQGYGIDVAKNVISFL